MGRLNLEDIAKHSGVSRSTVSRVINDSEAVSAETRKRVQAVIDELGFAPNPAARTLVTRRSQLIGVVLPRMQGFTFGSAVYYPMLLRGIADATDKHDYSMLLWLQEPTLHIDEERFYRRILRNRLMDGLIVTAPQDNPVFIRQLLDAKIRFVMVDRPSQYSDEIYQVSMDNVEAARVAVQHLIRCGRRRIAKIMAYNTNIEALERLQGYKLALAEAGLPYDEKLVVSKIASYAGGYEAMQQLLQCGIDAVFAGNDEMAYGALDAIQEAGGKVPDDVAIVGFDDLPRSAQTNPPLTTIRQPIVQRGVLATELLLDQIEGRVHEPCHIILPCELIVRGST